MTDQQLKELVASVATAQLETDRELKEMARETDRELKEMAREAERDRRALRASQRETDRQLKELGKQIGGLGEKFGTYTESLAEAGIRKLLKERFKMTTVALDVHARRNGENLQIDGLGYTNTDRNEAYVVEIKSKLRPEGIGQTLRLLRRFKEFFPDHRDKALYGILAVAEVPTELESKVLEQGLYLARLGSTVELAIPDDFKPRVF